jgi:hypothetical protein
MAIVPLTLTISLCLVFTFIIFFLREHARGRLSSAERDSLLPLADETPLVAMAASPLSADRSHAAVQHDDDAACGCLSGVRSPCAGCVKRREHA